MVTLGKSSLAAVVLVVAVLAGTCASSAVAAGVNENLLVHLNCTTNAVLKLGNDRPVLLLGDGLVSEIVGGVTQLHNGLSVTIGLTTYVLLKSSLVNLAGVDAIAKMVLTCGGSCGKTKITVLVYATVKNVLTLVATLCTNVGVLGL